MPKRALLIGLFLVVVVGIYIFGSDKDASAGSDGGSDAQCRVSVTADILNVRADSNSDSTIVGQLEHDTETDATTVVHNHYRKLADGRWAADKFLEPLDGASC